MILHADTAVNAGLISPITNRTLSAEQLHELYADELRFPWVRTTYFFANGEQDVLARHMMGLVGIDYRLLAQRDGRVAVVRRNQEVKLLPEGTKGGVE